MEKFKIFKNTLVIILLFITMLSFSACEKEDDTKLDWLIMYYVDADNDLEKDLMLDMNEIESVDINKANIKVVALVDRGTFWDGDGNWQDTRAYELGFENSPFNETLSTNTKRIEIPELGITTTNSVELNMGDKNTLSKFITFCNENYNAKKTMLLFTNHGGGWRDSSKSKTVRIDKITKQKAVCWDLTNNGDTLYMKEVREAITEAMGSQIFDIIAFDACYMGMIEVAYELKDLAKILIASKDSIPLPGFPYTQIFQETVKFDGKIKPNEFSNIIIDQYYDAYTQGTNVESDEINTTVTLSATDLSKVTQIARSINKLGAKLLESSWQDGDTRQFTETYVDSENIDIYNFCENISENYINETNKVKNAIEKSRITNNNDAYNTRIHGLAIYFPRIKELLHSAYSTTDITFAEIAPDWINFLSTMESDFYTDKLEYSFITHPFYEYIVGNDNPYNAMQIALSPEGNQGTLLNIDETIESFIFKPTDMDCFFFALPTDNLDKEYTLKLDIAENNTLNYALYVYGVNFVNYQPVISHEIIYPTGFNEYTLKMSDYNFDGFIALVMSADGSSSLNDSYSLSLK